MSKTKTPKYNGKHFTSALAFSRRASRDSVRDQAAADFAKFCTDATVPDYVTKFDMHQAQQLLAKQRPKDAPKPSIPLHARRGYRDRGPNRYRAGL